MEVNLLSILITGGAGYIGSHTCIELLNAGHEVIVIDNFLNSKPEALERVQQVTRKPIKIYQMNIMEQEKLEKIFSDNQIEAVIHFAGLKSVGHSVKNPLYYYRHNITSTLILCQVMQKFNVKNLVFSSSATVYGIPESIPISEKNQLSALNPYGRTKLFIESILEDLIKSDPSWSIVILRYFNPIGAHETGLIGEDPLGIPNNLMPNILNVASGERDTLLIYGDHYPTKDGTCIRDYIHINDLANGHVKALEKTLNFSGIETYNLGTGQGYSVLEIISTFEKVTGIKIPYSVSAPRAGDVPICYSDPTKAKLELDWCAKLPLEKMCIDSWRWKLNNPNGYKKVQYAN